MHRPVQAAGRVHDHATSSATARGFDDFSGDGFYVSGLWNITGETWGYKAGVPITPLPDEPGKGMWQLGLRYDTIDLNDGTVPAHRRRTSDVDGVLGGEMDSGPWA